MQWRAIHAAAAAKVALASGDTARALDVAESGLRSTIGALGVPHDSVRDLWPDAMEAALAFGLLDRASALLALVADRPVGHVPPYLRAHVARFRARIAAATDEHADVEEDFRTAERILTELDYVYWLARVQIDHAAWLIDRGRPAEATPLLIAAAATAERLGAHPAMAQINRLRATAPVEVEVDLDRVRQQLPEQATAERS